MNKPDAKLANSTSRIHQRQQAIGLRKQGKRIGEIATCLDVPPSTVSRWCQQYQQKGEAALKQQHRGAKFGKRRTLSPPEEETVQLLIQNHFPNELNIDSDLWTPQAVQALIACKWGVKMSIRTVGKCLKRWGYTPQPLQRADSLDPQAEKASLDIEYPAIEQQAQQEDAEIAWGDESGLLSDAQVDEPREKVEINIDIDKSLIEQKVEETLTSVKTDEFQELNQKAVTIRETIENNSEHQFEAQTPERSTSSEEMPIAQPAESIDVASEPASETETTAPLDPQFLQYCRQALSCCFELLAKTILEAVPLDSQCLEDGQQELSYYLEPRAEVIIKDILTKFPDITSEQLIEKIAAEVLSTQRAQEEFKNRMKLYNKHHSTVSVICDRKLASSQSSPLPPTVVQPVIQQAKLPPDTKDSTQVQPVRAYLIHVQTNREIELPQNLCAIHIGRPNDRISPDIDMSEFPNSEVVSRIHAVIHVEADRFYIEDMGSSNGTYINNSQLSPGDRFRLKPGNYISLGKKNLVQFLFQMGTDFA